jgi:hypothetical protein
MVSARTKRYLQVFLPAAVCVAGWLLYGQRPPAADPRLAQYRNLGKAFYENPTTQKQAVDQFRQALALAPNSARERLNLGLALLRAGDSAGGIAELEKAQKQDPRLPHTWFNLGIAHKKDGAFDKAEAQLREMIRLVPSEPIAHYQLGALAKLRDDTAGAQREFETARDLKPRLAAAHFQLYGLYRAAGRDADAARELATFQDLKKQQEGAAIPEDVEWCSYAEIYDPIAATPPPPAPQPAWRSERLGDGFTGVTALRLDGAGLPSLIAWSPSRVAIFYDGRTEIPARGLEDLRDVVFIAPGDYDNDGLPDLCVVTKTAALLYRNAGSNRFEKVGELARGSFQKAVWLDYDHDYDSDLFLLGDDQRLLRNNGAAGFSDESRRFPFVAGRALDGVRFDLEPDTPGFDLVVSYQDRPGVLYRDKLGGAYEAQPLPELPAGATDLWAADENRDGRTDLGFASGRLLLNLGGRFAPQSADQPPSVTADFGDSGRLSRARIANGGLQVDRDQAPNYGNWIEISLEGVKNAKIPLNAKIEVKARGIYQKFTYDGLPVVARLGGELAVDTVRITWPNGLVQNETGLRINRAAIIKEAPRLSGSCPMIFTWNGERFQFITDVLGVAPLGASSSDGEYFPVDHDEYVSIPAASLRPRDGGYDVRITEELHEVSYIDQVKLLALDHAAGVGIVTNEKFKAPPFPEFRLFGVRRKIHPASARDDHGSDVRAALETRDHVYPNDFRRDHAGVAELHTLDLDFGAAAKDNRAVLVLEGWVDWADGSTFLAAAQAHRDLVFPYLQVKDAAGNWKTVVEDMGIPSGKPKPMAVDLTGKFLSASREVRIVTNLCVYWDEVYLVEDSSPPEARLTAAPITAADLHFRGFSKPTIHPERQQPEQFDYSAVSFTSMWNPTPGNYTRYGAVGALLAEPDDRMVIMGSGDEISLRFAAGGLPPLPAGWTRDFLLLVDGWAKDADANTAFSQSVMPLPFHAMSRYPYPANERFPHADFVRDYLTRPALRLLRPLTLPRAEGSLEE